MMLETVSFPETADRDIASDDYARWFSGPVGAWFLEVRAAATLEMLAPYPGATILDVGGGHGQLTDVLIRNGYDVSVVGSDEACKRRIQQYVDLGRCTFEVADLLNLPYPDRSFGVVISYRLLPYTHRWERLLSELTRVADRAVIIDYPEQGSLKQRIRGFLRIKDQAGVPNRPSNRFTRSQLTQVFKQNQFMHGAHFTEFFFPMLLHRRLKSRVLSSGLENTARSLKLTETLGSPVILKMIRQPGS
jgi:ubiquinone/menaquinone biosynthesis C-methylase UbiE